MTAPGIMRKFKMTAIAAVDFPAQQGARMAIMKRDGSMDFDDSAYEKICKRTFSADDRKKATESGAAMPGGRYPIENAADLENAIHAVGRGKGSHAAIRSHIMSRARALGASDKIPADWKASKADESRLRNAIRAADFGFASETVSKFAARIAKDSLDGDPDEASLFDGIAKSEDGSDFDKADECYRTLCASVSSIMGDADAGGKPALLQKTFEQLKDAVQEVVPEALEPTIGKALGTSGSTDQMPNAVLAKALGLSETATDAEILKAAEKAKEAEKEKDDEKKKTEKRAEAIAKMSATHSGFMNNADAKMPKGGKEAFADMEPSERDAHMKANLIDDDDDDVEKRIKKGVAFRADDGTVFTKKDFGTDAAFNFAKRQSDQIIKQRDELAKSEDRRLTAEFAKRAEPLEFIAKADELGAILHDIAKFDAKLADRVEAVLKTANERLAKSDLLKEHGSGAGGGFSKAGGRIEALAKELLTKEPDLFKSARLDKMAIARTEIRKRHPELAKEESAEAAKERKAA